MEWVATGGYCCVGYEIFGAAAVLLDDDVKMTRIPNRPSLRVPSSDWAASLSPAAAAHPGLLSLFPTEGWEYSASLGVRFGSGRQRCCRWRRTLVPLLLSVSRWLMAVQCSRSVLEVVPGTESCSRSMSWSRARRRKEDCSWRWCSSPAISSQRQASIGGLHCNFQFFQGVLCKTPEIYCAILLIYTPFAKKNRNINIINIICFRILIKKLTFFSQ